MHNPLQNYTVTPPRYAFSPREVARAGAIWRLLQEVAVWASGDRGWPPQRYQELGTGFVLSEVTVRHHQEVSWGEQLEAETWIAKVQRGILVRRELLLSGPRGPVCSASQRWAHVGAGLVPGRAPPELLQAFAPFDRQGHSTQRLPAAEQTVAGPTHRMEFRCWQSWIDPLGHVNHPSYIDWCDEAIQRVLAAGGVDPHRLRALGERVRWRSGVVAGDAVRVHTRVVGVDASGALHIQHDILGDDDRVFACARTLRALAGEADNALMWAMMTETT